MCVGSKYLIFIHNQDKRFDEQNPNADVIFFFEKIKKRPLIQGNWSIFMNIFNQIELDILNDK